MLGITKIRQLVLSDAPSLIYIDPKENGGTVKGEVDWPPGNPPQATFVSPMFDILVCLLYSSRLTSQISS